MTLFIISLLFVLAIGAKDANKLATILVCGALCLIPLGVLLILALCYGPLAWGLGAAAVVGIIAWIINLFSDSGGGGSVSYDVNGDKI